MNVFDVHRGVMGDYKSYIQSFINISDQRIKEVVDSEIGNGKLWPEPLLQFNPAFRVAGNVADLAANGTVHSKVADIFTGYSLYQHQLEAIRLGSDGKDFIVTSGTGSGKSLTYIGTIFSHLLNNPSSSGVVAVVVYPMNALINSQTEEFTRYQQNYAATGQDFPITFGQYTGQEDESKREVMRKSPPQILLTNYMMLELLLTRTQERTIRDAIYENLRYLVFDELHTYRGRQGADVAMLIRRIRAKCKHDITCIGTSATMVSKGSLDEQQQKVAEVASTLFGKEFQSSQIITETLDRSLPASSQPPSNVALAEAVRTGVVVSADVEALRSHPLAVWMEREAAVEERDGRLVRRRPRSVGDLSKLLSEETGETPSTCRTVLEQILLWISAVNESIQRSGSRNTILPFRLHQFISQTGSVYTTLDQGEDRFITLEPGIYRLDDETQKPIYPNVFSRPSGHPFICVTMEGDKLIPREFLDSSEDDEDSTKGYLIVGDVWNPEEDLDSLPDSWFKTLKSGRKLDPNKEAFIPKCIYFDEYGNCSTSRPMKYQGWFMPAPLPFDPTSGTFYDRQTRDGTKLAKLGSEGRSTSTTITTFSILTQLRESNYKLQVQKLLSFTDNRQDAALQAGHFNDFVSVVQLRSGVYHALRQAPNNRLTYTSLGEAVFRALSLPFTDYSTFDKVPELPSVREKYERCFQDFLLYRAIEDLRRSWRIILPNLEQCALLDIEYDNIREVADAHKIWMGVPVLEVLDNQKRLEFLNNVIDFFRLEYALHSKNYLESSIIKEHELAFREQLRAPWTLDDRETIALPKVIRLDALANKTSLASSSMGPQSGLGKFIKQFVKSEGIDPSILRGDSYRDFILTLMEKLVDADYLVRIPAKGKDGKEVHTFRLKIDKIIWKLGDGVTVKPDVIKRRSFRDVTIKPNAFFSSMYRNEFSRHKRLRAEDHTGQLDKDSRLDREDRFRCEWWLNDSKKLGPDHERIRRESISALFCSPTMELGVDIGGLSVVHMRNAPPNSANYAQRSGRAGRSGQGALVFTYCSTYSPHDRHYFEHQTELVAGAVEAPRLDLCNEELLTSHLNALAVSEIGLPGLESAHGSTPSLAALVEMSEKGMPLRESVRIGLKLNTTVYDSVRSSFKRAIGDFEAQLATRGRSWYTETWIDRNLQDIADNLDDAMKRWRKLYMNAMSMLSAATATIGSGVYHRSSDEYKHADKQQDQSTNQLNQLVNNTGKRSSDLSEFYPYRYLASEGFLPGYNFTRLPVRLWVKTSHSAGEYISRPRSLALREFGPLNVIYHNGRKYRVDQLVLQDIESALSEVKISKKAGYVLADAQKDLEICPFSNCNLGDNANRELLTDLLEMSESRASEVARISCEEEERVSKGFETNTYFTDDGASDRIKRLGLKYGDVELLNVRYIPAARLVYISRKWRSSKFQGFPIGMTSGNWKSAIPDQEEQKEQYRYVMLKTFNIADALYIEPVEPLGLSADGVVTLQHALKRGIEIEFQVESNEIGVVAIGDEKQPNILIYEAAEGSLGILSRLAEEVDALKSVVQRAIEVCQYDRIDYKAKASYDDLLSYYNQRDHQRIDRFSIKEALEKMLAAEVEVRPNVTFANYDEHYQFLLNAFDPNSSLERKFLEYLYANNLRLPDAAQKRLDGIYCQPDFYYDSRFWVFVDGSPHDKPDVQEKDQKQRQAIMDRGDEVWSWHYSEDLAQKIASRPDIFRKVR
jgi:superfamily II DNA/RNA helicase